MRTGDPIRDFDRLEEKHEQWLESLPVCVACGRPIQDEKCIMVSGEKWHKGCFEEEHEFFVDDLV